MTTEHVSVPRKVYENLAQIAEGKMSKHNMQDLAAEAYNILSRATPSAPRVVTDEDVERAVKAWGVSSSISDGMRAALESFATSLPAERVPTLTREQVVKLLSLACEEMDVINHHLQKMLAAAPQTEK